MPCPPEKLDPKNAEVQQATEGIKEEIPSYVKIQMPEQLPDLPAQLPYAGSFADLVRFLNAQKEHAEVIKSQEIALPRGTFLYVTPPGEDLQLPLSLIARQFNMKFAELQVTRILAEDIPSTHVVGDAIEKCRGDPQAWGALLYIPDFEELLNAFQLPAQVYVLSQQLGEIRATDASVVIVIETHDVRAIPPVVRTQVDFVQALPPLASDEALGVLRTLVKCELPWESPDLLCTPLWLNQLRRVGARINLFNLTKGSKTHKIAEKDIAKIIREVIPKVYTTEAPAENTSRRDIPSVGEQLDVILPKNLAIGDQILQGIATNHFTTACSVLDKFMQGESVNMLTESERALVSENGILMSDNPAKLKVRLLAAKKKVDAILNLFKRG